MLSLDIICLDGIRGQLSMGLPLGYTANHSRRINNCINKRQPEVADETGNTFIPERQHLNYNRKSGFYDHRELEKKVSATRPTTGNSMAVKTGNIFMSGTVTDSLEIPATNLGS